MKAVIIKGLHQVKVEDWPIPSIQAPGDVIIKTHVSGLCGSDLHNYRQTEPGTGFILGHEIVGEIIEIGTEVTKWKVGDLVASPFSTCCGSCWYCEKGYTARCTQSQGFGMAGLEGCQAEYVRQPLADGSLFAVPSDVPSESMLLLADILSTGFSCAHNARRLLDEDDERDDWMQHEGVAVVYGCGPVGLCAISSACTMFTTVFATDPNPERREMARQHGAVPVTAEELKEKVLKATEGRGADAALDLVGGPALVNTCLDVIRPYGVVSSIGMQMKRGDIDYPLLYSKNARMQFGRCNVRRFFPLAAKVLAKNTELFSKFITHRIRFEDAAEYYELFNAGKIGKTVFVADGFPLQKQ